MKEAVYSFSNSSGDKFYIRLAADSDLFLSKEMSLFLKDKDFELWGIYLERLGNVQKVAPVKLLNKVSQLIATFFIGHPNAILYYVRKMNISVVDTPIYIDACGNDVYIHLISREKHTDIVKIISKDIHEGFDK